MKKILCLPYAGGSAQVFRGKFENYLDDTIRVQPIELPGRGTRFAEDLITDFSKLLNDLLYQVYTEINCDDDYALFGYSMGSKLIYEMYYEIEKMHWKRPEMLFICAAAPPEIPVIRKKKDDLSIITNMKRLGGTSDEIFACQEMLDVFLPIMRADMQILESYKYEDHKEKIKIPIVVQYGRYDSDIKEYISDWKNHTVGECFFYEYESGHFFINEEYERMTEIINKHLAGR